MCLFQFLFQLSPIIQSSNFHTEIQNPSLTQSMQILPQNCFSTHSTICILLQHFLNTFLNVQLEISYLYLPQSSIFGDFYLLSLSVESQVDQQRSVYSIYKHYQTTLQQMQVLEHCILPPSSPQGTQDPLVTSPSLQNKYQLDLVTQYLDLNSNNTSFQVEPNTSSISDRSNDLFASNAESSFIGQQNKGKKISIFHNFQKHVIVILKTKIKISKNCIIDGTKCTLSSQLWDYVTSSCKSSKNWFLGVLSSNLQENQQLKNDPRWKDIHERVIEAGERKVREAQDYLRRTVVRQAFQLLERKQLRGRRIQRLQEFELYFREFMSYLEKGEAYRRLPKLKRKEMEQKRGQSNLMS